MDHVEVLPCPFCGKPGELLGAMGEYVVTCSADEDECNPSPSTWVAPTAEKAIAAWNLRAAPTAKPEGEAVAPDGWVLVRREAIDWLNGESDFECPPDRYFRGKPPRYWWRSVFREKAGLDEAALAVNATPSSHGVVVDEAMVERAAAGLYAHLRPDATVKWEDLNDYEADKIRSEARAALVAALGEVE